MGDMTPLKVTFVTGNKKKLEEDKKQFQATLNRQKEEVKQFFR